MMNLQPKDLLRIHLALKNIKRLEIAVSLVHRGGFATIYDLLADVKIDQRTLEYHLSTMYKAQLVFYNAVTKLYSATPICKEILEEMAKQVGV